MSNNRSRWQTAFKHPTYYFPTSQYFGIKRFFAGLNQAQREILIQHVPLKSPYICLLLSFCLGFLGVDRWYVGDKQLAVLKVLSMPFGIGVLWYLFDTYLCYSKGKFINYQRLKQFISIK
ncbi:TM2 domain-containing protein [Haemophilus parahaemolyticus]|uniref:TM2 domain-containing protein n=1 Tax=Haemophilus parahaemolyticus TaxID=735 RepID=UPI002066ACC3|nr:TM2 domain-containing protein [Haemophilus parahaemolyticus]DAW07775.1 MAG TPA: TM2 domain [Caudoviricetes sp.]